MEVPSSTSQAVLSDYSQNQKRLSAVLDRLASGKLAESPKNDPSLWNQVKGLEDQVKNLRQFSENLERAASSVRIALEAMEVSEAHLDQLEEKLRTALSNPENSPERARSLREYNEIFPLLDDLKEVPDPGAKQLLSDGEEQRFEIRAGENSYSVVLRSRPIGTGAGGLDLPRVGDPLPSDPGGGPLIADGDAASDPEINRMIEALEGSRQRLVDQQKALSVDASALENSTEVNGAIIGRNETHLGEINVPDLNAEAVLSQSLSLQNRLALEGLIGLNNFTRSTLRLIE